MAPSALAGDWHGGSGMKPEIKRYFDEHSDLPRPEQRQALLAAGHSSTEVDDAFLEFDRGAAPVKTATFDRWAGIFHIVGIVWVAYWLLILPDKIAEGQALTAFAVVAVALVIGWLVSTWIGRRLLPSIGLWALVLPFLSALIITFGMFNIMGGKM
jgi:hypothetical protein